MEHQSQALGAARLALPGALLALLLGFWYFVDAWTCGCYEDVPNLPDGLATGLLIGSPIPLGFVVLALARLARPAFQACFGDPPESTQVLNQVFAGKPGTIADDGRIGRVEGIDRHRLDWYLYPSMPWVAGLSDNELVGALLTLSEGDSVTARMAARVRSGLTTVNVLAGAAAAFTLAAVAVLGTAVWTWSTSGFEDWGPERVSSLVGFGVAYTAFGIFAVVAHRKAGAGVERLEIATLIMARDRGVFACGPPRSRRWI